LQAREDFARCSPLDEIRQRRSFGRAMLRLPVSKARMPQAADHLTERALRACCETIGYSDRIFGPFGSARKLAPKSLSPKTIICMASAKTRFI
jgi:hypothetical protein